MAPTLIAPSQRVDNSPEIADRMVANKFIYRYREQQRGELVIFLAEDGNIQVKRVVGLPGETVDIQSPFTLINGEKLTNPPIFETISQKKNGFSGYVRPEALGAVGIPLPITLKSNEYFLMGDNTSWSRDSRFTGPVYRDAIQGKAIRIYWPPRRMGELE